jgi:hypothetical protein
MPQTTDEGPKTPWVKAPDGVPEYYANMANIMWSLDDVRLRLGQLVESPESNDSPSTFKSMAQERAAVTMSWRNAKILATQLTQIVENYERVNGKIDVDIKLPPSV